VAVLVGQTASQTLTVIVPINSTGGQVGAIIDKLVTINGVQISGITFDKQDKTNDDTNARKIAYNDAKKKASDYVGFASKTLGAPLQITDQSSNSAPVFYASAALVNSPSSSTTINPGTITVSANVNIVFSYY
jgi:uncharacterized protein YggE